MIVNHPYITVNGLESMYNTESAMVSRDTLLIKPITEVTMMMMDDPHSLHVTNCECRRYTVTFLGDQPRTRWGSNLGPFNFLANALSLSYTSLLKVYVRVN